MKFKGCKGMCRGLQGDVKGCSGYTVVGYKGLKKVLGIAR